MQPTEHHTLGAAATAAAKRMLTQSRRLPMGPGIRQWPHTLCMQTGWFSPAKLSLSASLRRGAEQGMPQRKLDSLAARGLAGRLAGAARPDAAPPHSRLRTARQMLPRRTASLCRCCCMRYKRPGRSPCNLFRLSCSVLCRERTATS